MPSFDFPNTRALTLADLRGLIWLRKRAALNFGGLAIIEFRVVARIDLSSDTNGRLDDLIRSQPNDTSDLLRNRCLSLTDVGL
jgi:hypothetical protein